MKTKNSNHSLINRWRFLTDCTKLAMGTALLSLSAKSFADGPDNYKDYSYCIYKCPVSCTYDPSCKGCRVNDEKKCEVKDCVIERKLQSCAHCSSLKDCDKKLWLDYPQHRGFVLKKQEEWGLI